MKTSRLFAWGLVLLAIMLPPSVVPGERKFPVPELFGRPTHSPVAVNAAANAAMEACFPYGTESGNYPLQTNTVSSPAGEPLKAFRGRSKWYPLLLLPGLREIRHFGAADRGRAFIYLPDARGRYLQIHDNIRSKRGKSDAIRTKPGRQAPAR
jgi:hypothetical protein